MPSAHLIGRLEIDAAGVPATLVAGEDSIVVSSNQPADLVAETLRLRRAAPLRARLRDLPLAVELHGPRGLVVGARPRRGRVPALRLRRPLTLVRGWWRSRRPTS